MGTLLQDIEQEMSLLLWLIIVYPQREPEHLSVAPRCQVTVNRFDLVYVVAVFERLRLVGWELCTAIELL